MAFARRFVRRFPLRRPVLRRQVGFIRRSLFRRVVRRRY